MTTQVAGTYADIYGWDNLWTDYCRAAKGKRGKWPAAGFEFRLVDNLVQHEEWQTPTASERERALTSDLMVQVCECDNLNRQLPCSGTSRTSSILAAYCVEFCA